MRHVVPIFGSIPINPDDMLCQEDKWAIISLVTLAEVSVSVMSGRCASTISYNLCVNVLKFFCRFYN